MGQARAPGRKAAVAVTAELDPGSKAAVERWVAAAPPLSEAQKDVIASALAGALKHAKRASPPMKMRTPPHRSQRRSGDQCEPGTGHAFPKVSMELSRAADTATPRRHNRAANADAPQDARPAKRRPREVGR